MTTKPNAEQFATPPRTLSPEVFIATFGGIYEHSDWVAKAVLEAGLDVCDDGVAHLAGRMAAIVDAANRPTKLALLRAHPELAGKLAVAGNLTVESTVEQASAGLDKCSPEEFARLQSLNADYKTKFGHPFIIAVRGLSRTDIITRFEDRMTHDAAVEFDTALAEVHKIARLRLSFLT